MEKDKHDYVPVTKGYPGKYKTDKHIKNLKTLKLSKDEYIFHAGTKFQEGKFLSNGESFKYYIYW